MFQNLGQGFLWLVQQGISCPRPLRHLPAFPLPFLLCPFMDITRLSLPGCDHPTSPPSKPVSFVCPSQEGVRRPLPPCQPAWVGCGPAPCGARPKPQAGRGQRHSSEARPPGSFPLHPLPGPEDKGASQRSVAFGLRLQEAQPRGGGGGLLSARMSGELGRDLVPGTSLINKFFLCQPGRAGGMMWGGHVHVSQACLRSV